MRNLAVAVVFACVLSPSAAESFYKEPPLFNFTHANETVGKQSIDKFGPVGMSVELRLPPFQMVVGRIEEGSVGGGTGPAVLGRRLRTYPARSGRIAARCFFSTVAATDC